MHATEDAGVNTIPLAMAEPVAERCGWTVVLAVVQGNVVGHTGRRRGNLAP